MSRAARRRAFARAHVTWAGAIERFASRLAEGDRDLEEDLAQVGRIALWRAPAGASALAVRCALWRRMHDFRGARTTRSLVA